MSAPEVTQVLSTLRRIEEPSKFLLGSSNPNNMLGRWAKDYYEGAYVKRRAQIDTALRDGKPDPGGQGMNNNEGGVSYIVCFRSVVYHCMALADPDLFQRLVEGCADIGDAWRQLPQQLDEAASKEELVKVIYDPYKNVGS